MNLKKGVLIGLVFFLLAKLAYSAFVVTGSGQTLESPPIDTTYPKVTSTLGLAESTYYSGDAIWAQADDYDSTYYVVVKPSDAIDALMKTDGVSAVQAYGATGGGSYFADKDSGEAEITTNTGESFSFPEGSVITTNKGVDEFGKPVTFISATNP